MNRAIAKTAPDGLNGHLRRYLLSAPTAAAIRRKGGKSSQRNKNRRGTQPETSTLTPGEIAQEGGNPGKERTQQNKNFVAFGKQV